MTKKNKRNNKMREHTETICFKNFVTSTVNPGSVSAPTIQTLDLRTQLDPRITGISDYFQYFRYKYIKLTILNQLSGTTITLFSMGYVPNTPNTAPTDHSEIAQCTASIFHPTTKTVPTSLQLTSRMLIGDAPLKWYQTKQGTEDAEWETQGQVFLAFSGSGTSVSYIYTVEGQCEFRGRSPAVSTPMAKNTKELPGLPSGNYDSPSLSKDSPLPFPWNNPSTEDVKPTMEGGISSGWVKLGRVDEVDLNKLQNVDSCIIGGMVWIRPKPGVIKQ